MPESNDDVSEATVALTVRLPQSLHQWLKSEAGYRDTSMSAIVRQELEACRSASEETEQELPQPFRQPYLSGEIMPGAGWVSGPCEAPRL